MTRGWSLYARTLFARAAGCVGFGGFAICCACRTNMDDWRERLLPMETAEFVGTEDGELAFLVEHPRACSACGGWEDPDPRRGTLPK